MSAKPFETPPDMFAEAPAPLCTDLQLSVVPFDSVASSLMQTEPQTITSSEYRLPKPKLGEAEAAYLIGRGRVVGRIAAKQAVYEAVMEIIEGPDCPDSISPTLDELTADMAKLQAELEDIDRCWASKAVAQPQLLPPSPHLDPLFEPVTAEHEPLTLTYKPSIDLEDEDKVPITDIVTFYRKDLVKFELLTAEQEVELAKTIEAGVLAEELLQNSAKFAQYAPNLCAPHDIDSSELRRELVTLVQHGKASCDLFIASNLRLPFSIARRYTGLGVPLADLLQEANIGLYRAVQKFDHQKGYKFSTYAMWWIRQGITHALDGQSSTIRVSGHESEKIRAMSKLRATFVSEHNRPPTNGELADKMGITVDRLAKLQEHERRQNPLSLDMRVGNGDSEFGEFIRDEDATDPEAYVVRELSVEQQRYAVEEMMEILSLEQYEVLKSVFGITTGSPMTLETTGQLLGLTTERVRRIRNEAVDILRSRSQLFEEFRLLIT